MLWNKNSESQRFKNCSKNKDGIHMVFSEVSSLVLRTLLICIFNSYSILFLFFQFIRIYSYNATFGSRGFDDRYLGYVHLEDSLIFRVTLKHVLN